MAGKRISSDTVLVETLTAREREILTLLGQRLTSPEIAAELTLALSTVKWYIQQIYGKLGVNSRRQAVARARELELLESNSQPELRSVARHNLPRQLTRFIGRQQEMIEVRALLEGNPLVTLTGPGGVGKTRLGLQVADELVKDFSDGVWLVEFAAITSPDRVATNIVHALGLREDPNLAIGEVLESYLKHRRMLLVLDNCEHLIDACAKIAMSLLRGCPQLKLLASSREALGITGEVVYLVPSLSLPDPQKQVALAQLGEYDAVRLFAGRAQAVQPSFQITTQNESHVLSICQRLDGIPLALELAASRLNVLDTAELDARLSDVFHVLTAGARTALPRHQTLRAAIDWSYQLLSPAERLLLRRLSAFAGGWSLEDAESICAGDGLGQADVFDLLASLVAKSMVMTVRAEGRATRYRLLDTVQQYAQEMLSQTGEEEILCERHAAHYFTLVDRYAAAFNLPDELRLQKRIEENLPNLHSALDWALGGAAVDQGVQAVLALWDVDYWRVHGMEEWRLWLEKAACLIDPHQPSLELASLWRHQGLCLWYQGQYEAAFALLMSSREMFAALGSELDYAKVNIRCGAPSKRIGEQPGTWARASAYFEESAAIFRKLGAENWLAFVLNGWGNFETVIRGNHMRALELLTEAESLCQKIGGSHHTYLNQAMVYLRLRQNKQARQFSELALREARRRGYKLMDALLVYGQLELAEATDLAGLSKAEGYLREGLELVHKFPSGAECLLGLAEVAASQDQLVECTRLLGALAGSTGKAAGDRKGSLPESAHFILEVVRGKLDETTFRQAWEEGLAMTFEQAVSLTLEELLQRLEVYSKQEVTAFVANQVCKVGYN